MARTTQLIGLNKYATDFIENAKKNGNIIREEHYVMDRGMFEEEVYGTVYYLKAESPNKELILREVTQVTPWSGGPMIFTHFKATLIKKSGAPDVDMGYYFSWMVDPTVDGEFNHETGRYYI